MIIYFCCKYSALSLGARKGKGGGLVPYSLALPLVARYTRRLSLVDRGGGRPVEVRRRLSLVEEDRRRLSLVDEKLRLRGSSTEVTEKGHIKTSIYFPP